MQKSVHVCRYNTGVLKHEIVKDHKEKKWNGTTINMLRQHEKWNS